MDNTALFNQKLTNTPLGELEVICSKDGLCAIKFDPETGAERTNEITHQVASQLKEYFNNERTSFEIELCPQGTEFQKKVWQELGRIPFGETISYEELATQLGDKLVIRAAASANGKNPIPIIIPCHRVIGKDGSLTGYSGGIWRKQKLLEIENSVLQRTLF